jgi:putative membrane-bound dehydrogenase-like protein
MDRRLNLVALCLLALALPCPCLAAPPVSASDLDLPPAKSPADSLRSIRMRPGFTVELVASEPLVADPIAFDWGADGRLWVVEMGDYPLGVDGKGKPGGVVRALEDTDGDGHYDKATTFLEGLGFPTGLLPWRNGLLIACAPDIFYAEDRDGDGKADHREVLFTGFNEGNQQHRVNGLDLGLDGWVYGANGDSGGRVRSLKTGQTVSIQGRDFRFRPDDGRFEAESGQTQFGRHRDDWGHWFGNNNPNFAWEYVLTDAEIRRNPRLALPNARQMLEPDTRVYPTSRTLARFNSPGAVNHVTSANSPTPYRDDLFGPDFASSLFVSEPVNNLVHRIVLEPQGATYTGQRAADETTSEFFASSDNWCRPTMLRTGPDGALWIADMYRAVIEHPQWIPDDWEAKLDLRAGSDQGRIYRVYPEGKKPRPIPRLDQLDTAGLVAALNSPSGWQRDTAQRLLVHRNDPAAIGLLRSEAGSSARPQTRVQALWTLENLGALTDRDIQAALADPHPQVRRNALRASESLLRDKTLRGSVLASALSRLADDPDAQVRFQLALSLSQWDDPRAGSILAQVVRRDGADPWTRAAALSSAPAHLVPLLTALFEGARDAPPPAAVVEPLFALAGALDDRPALESLVRAMTTPSGPGGAFAPWQFSALAGWRDASARARRPLDPGAEPRFAALFSAARAVAADEKASEDDRLRALRLLGRDAADQDVLAALFRPQVSSALQQAAVAALARSDDRKTAEMMLAGWKGHSPQLRSVILDAVLSRPAWTSALLSSLEDTCTPPAEIDPAHRKRLLDHRDPKVKERAAAIFEGATTTRQAVLDAYRPALASPGDPAAGALVFQKICATCHRLGGAGNDVGPDLAALADKTPESLLVAILDPNRAAEARYTSFNVSLSDGRVLTGMIAGETATSVTLRRQEGKEDVLLRSDIEAMAGSGQSLMPEGVEKDIPPRSMADLIAFLKTVGPPPKSIAGNHPERVRPASDGSVVLRAETAEIFGETLTYEPLHQNLGFWSARTDRAAWTFDAPRAGRYRVWLDWACDDRTAGNTLVLAAGKDQLETKVAGTGSWDRYEKSPIGEVTLPEGPQRLELFPAGQVRGALLDLRSVELRPY